MADDSEYRTILAAALAGARAALGASWNYALLESPRYDPAWLDLDACVVAPRGDLVEGLAVKKLTFKNAYTQLSYEVFVGLFTDARSNDPALLFKRLAGREKLRLGMWDPDLINKNNAGAALGDYDADYDPMGMGGEPAPANVRGTWQKFTVTVRTRRQT